MPRTFRTRSQAKAQTATLGPAPDRWLVSRGLEPLCFPLPALQMVTVVPTAQLRHRRRLAHKVPLAFAR